MKIGILTFINTINFGASLQSYALQEVIESFGIKVEVIQYKNEAIENKELNRGKRSWKIKGIVKKIVMGRGMKNKRRKFQEYEEQNIRKGIDFQKTAIREINKYYDKFITGSDQVWNMEITHEDWNYFLEFVIDEKKKVSYAPSFGNPVFRDSCKEKARELLNGFHALSVREQSGKDFIYNLCNREAMLVVDPTLLLDRQKWEAKIIFVPKVKNYILVYFPHKKKSVFEFVKKLRAKTGCSVIYLSISPRIQRGMKTIYDASPDEFLGWVKHAAYVVTGSFHGTAFSLNLEKQFFYEPSGSGSRIDNIVKMCGVENRGIDGDGVMNTNINYEIVRERLADFRAESKEWLEKAVRGD
jgi:Polysaccharide pyruvyl transferase.